MDGLTSNNNLDHFRSRFWVGDFPPHRPGVDFYPDYDPFSPLVVYPYEQVYPLSFPMTTVATTNITITGNSWRVTVRKDDVFFSIDVPGCTVSDITLSVSPSGSMTVVATRPDTKTILRESISIYDFNDRYDLTSVDAVLAAGVLSVTIKRAVDNRLRDVIVSIRSTS